MGGHGGLNILPQKRWNVYNFDNREKVRKDEEEAAKEEQLKREQSRKRDTEFRIQQLRQARGLSSASESVSSPKAEAEPEPKSRHINLFEGIRILDPVEVGDKVKSELGDEKRKGFKRMRKEAEVPKVILPEDEKYRLGYGVAGKGVKLPWYMEKRANGEAKGVDNGDDCGLETVSKSNRKKSVEELREERLKREGKEKERERALLQQQGRRGASVRNDRGYSRRYADLLCVLPTGISVVAWPMNQSKKSPTMGKKGKVAFGNKAGPMRLLYAEAALCTLSLPEAFAGIVLNLEEALDQNDQPKDPASA